jgi:hypothetical protein
MRVQDKCKDAGCSRSKKYTFQPESEARFATRWTNKKKAERF